MAPLLLQGHLGNAVFQGATCFAQSGSKCQWRWAEKTLGDIEQFLLQLFFGGARGRGPALMPLPKLGSDPTMWFWASVFTSLSLCFLV